MADTKIDWCDKVWNPVTGCTKVSAGCKNCYAERMAKRLAGRASYPAENPFAVTLHPERLDQPLHWRKPQRVFVNSMSDLFHEDVPDEFIARVWQTMAMTRQHTFKVLTKRPDRMKQAAKRLNGFIGNIWLGVSVEDQATADERIPILLQTQAAVRFVSYEPALGPVSLRWIAAFDGKAMRPRTEAGGTNEYDGLRRLDWIIAGGESGPYARPAHADWFRSVRDQCAAAGVPFFLKQVGEWTVWHERDRGFNPGRRSVVMPDGAIACSWSGFDNPPREVYQVKPETGAVCLTRVGKRTAGHLLDGVEHRAFPTKGPR